MPGPKVEVLWWSGCPSTPRALEELRDVMAELGIDPETVDIRAIETDEQAEAEAFAGSPTIRVNGSDVQPPAQGEPVGLSCRVYTLRDGRRSPTPDRSDVRDALRRAVPR